VRLAAGARLGPYEIVAPLGAGGMGEVYRARDTKLGRDVALKILPASSIASESARTMFHREALALSRLNHPNIATVHEFRAEGDLEFMVMEYVRGDSLDVRAQNGPLAESEVIRIGIQLAEGLAEAHRHGVIHRDLKPGNLKVTTEGRLKILDFGLAQWRATESNTLTAAPDTGSSAVAGTAAYLAPELIRGAPASERSDLYSAGVVLYELATGSSPFPGLPVGALLETITTRRPPTPRTRNPQLSPELEQVILRCMEPRPEDRVASAEELARELRSLAGESVPGRRPLGALGIAVLITLVAVAAAGGLAVWRRSVTPGNSQASTLRSLAVLPLANLTSDPEQDYVAEGMTEQLISQLSRVRALRVISLTSVMRYRNSPPPMRQIAQELNVDGVIEGSVIRFRGQLRTTVHLIAAREDDQLWSGQYDGDTTDVLGLQTRVAKAIVHEIRVRLTAEERARLTEAPRVDPVAYELFLRGRYQWNKRSDAAIRLSIDYLERAVRQDSTYALAYAGLADAWASAGLYGLMPPIDVRERARAAAQRAIELDPELPEAHAALATILHNFDWNWGGAEREYQRAIELNSGSAIAHHGYAHLLAQQGRFDAARDEINKALALDPLALPTVLASGVIEYYAGDYAGALERYARAAELDSTNALLHRLRAGVYDRFGREPDAVRELSLSFTLRGQPEVGAMLMSAYHLGGVKGALEFLIGGLIRRRETGSYEPAEHIAELYTRLGRANDAFEWFAVAVKEHDTELNRLRVDPLFMPLRKDPRYAELLRQVGLAAETPAPQ
jgi:serine/threonine-protein kinase